MLRAWPPFCRWGLPAAGDVKFHVSRARGHDAAWWIDGSTHHIEASQRKHGHLVTLIASMGHEMIHLRQRQARTETPNTEHNAQFLRLTSRVCRRYGWDEGQFL